MYIATQFGFFSIVRKSFDPATGEEYVGENYQVRGVELEDMKNLLTLYRNHPLYDKKKHHIPTVQETHYADYRYRMQIKPEEMEVMMHVLMDSIDYKHFKKGVLEKGQQSKKAKAYENLREELLKIQKD